MIGLHFPYLIGLQSGPLSSEKMGLQNRPFLKSGRGKSMHQMQCGNIDGGVDLVQAPVQQWTATATH